MARGHGRILSRIWRDPDFRALTAEQQRLYFFLVSQDNLNHAGVLPLTLRRWTTTAAGLTFAALQDQLDQLDWHRFIVIDDDTEELLIRTFIRNDEVYKQPNVMLSAVASAQEIVSTRLRLALLEELDRLPLEELKDEPTKSGGPSARKVVEGCIQTLRDTLGVPSGDPNPRGTRAHDRRDTGTLPGTLPETHAGQVPEEPPAKASETHEPTLAGRVPGTLPETLPGTLETVLTGVVVESGPDWLPAEWETAGQDSEPNPSGTLPGTLPGTPYARAHAHSPTPSPFPEPFPPSAGGEPPATGRTLELVHSAPAVAAVPTTTDELIADWIDHVPKRPPGSVIGRVGKAIKKLIEEDVDPVDIRAGLAAWARKGADPSSLPSFVNQAMNATGRGIATAPPGEELGGDAHMSRYLARAAARKARGA